MSIELHENEWAKNMIATKSLGKKPSETLRRVARYYMDEYNIKGSAVRDKLEGFLLVCEPLASVQKWSKALDYAVVRATKTKSINIDYISITGREMAAINALSGTQLRRLAFTLLCLAKFWNSVIPDGNGWVNSKDGDIMAMANINTSIKRQSGMYSILRDEGLIEFSKKVDNTNVRVCFISSGDDVLHITDFRNLGYQYLMYRGEPYFVCQNCGVVTKLESKRYRPNQKYCRSCAVSVATKQRVDCVMSRRKFGNNTIC